MARTIACPEAESVQRKVAGTVLMVLGSLGCSANLLVILVVILVSGCSGLGLVVHQCVVDCARAALLFPLGWSLLTCTPVIPKCSGGARGDGWRVATTSPVVTWSVSHKRFEPQSHLLLYLV